MTTEAKPFESWCVLARQAKEMADLATRGDWRWQWIGNAMHLVAPPGSTVVLSATVVAGQVYLVARDEHHELVPPSANHPDAAFIAASRMLVPRLAEGIELLASEVERLRGEIEDMQSENRGSNGRVTG